MANGKRKLDRSKPFGQVYGDESGASFEQHGILFDAPGNEMPGFEDVEIQEEQVVVVDDSKVAELININTSMVKANSVLRENLDRAIADKGNAESDKEEIQGKLDTAEIEVKRLREQVAELEKQVPVLIDADTAEPAEKAKGNRGGKKTVDKTATEEQLGLQQQGNV